MKLPNRSAEESAFDTRVAKLTPGIFKLTNELTGSIRLAAHLAADDMRSEGYDKTEVEYLLNDFLRRFVDPDEDKPVSEELQQRLVDAILAMGGMPPKQMLLEYLVKTETGYRMFVWPNESKHPGRPHVTVILDRIKINVSISSEPEVLAGPKRSPGIGKVLKAVAENEKALLKEWHQTRPDDQKTKNFRAKQSKANPKERK